MSKRKSQYAEKHPETKQVAPIFPKNPAQEVYFKNLAKKQLNLAIGDSGCGKTFIASWWAAKQFLAGEVDKIIISRPYITMGKDAGAVPGTDFEKLYPYLRPVLDNLKKFLGAKKFEYMLKHDQLEVVVTEKVRGRSFDERCIYIGDEHQNTTKDQIIAITTRIGESCQMILCGDPKQKDVRGFDGLTYLKTVVEDQNLTSIGVNTFTRSDCVRSGMARILLDAFAKVEGGF